MGDSIMLFMCCCALTLFDKASEIFFSMRENNTAVAHKHIFVKNYNSWRNFGVMYLFFSRFFGNKFRKFLIKSAVALFVVIFGSFCFYSFDLLGLSGIGEILSSNDQYIDLNHWFLQVLVQGGILQPILPGYVRISYTTLLMYESIILSPAFAFVGLAFINNILINWRVLKWLSIKKRPLWQSGGVVAGCSLGTFGVELIMFLLMLSFIYLLSFVSHFGIVQEGKFDAEGHRVGWGIGVDIGSQGDLGGRVWSAPLFTQDDFDKTKPRQSFLDAITHRYNGSPSRTVEYRGVGNSQEHYSTCQFPGLSEKDCVKKARTMLLEGLGTIDRPSKGPLRSVVGALLEISSMISPYACSATSRSAIASGFSEDWQKTMVGLIAVPIYVILAIYISRLIFSTVIPFALLVDFVIIRQARKIFGNETARTHLLRHFGYFSLLPIAAAIWLIGRLSSWFC